MHACRLRSVLLHVALTKPSQILYAQSVSEAPSQRPAPASVPVAAAPPPLVPQQPQQLRRNPSAPASAAAAALQPLTPQQQQQRRNPPESYRLVQLGKSKRDLEALDVRARNHVLGAVMYFFGTWPGIALAR